MPTILLLAYQGLTLGAFIALHYNRGLTVDFLGWIAIHGVTEISAILLCGAAGLVLAEKILFPDRYSRVDSLAMHGRRAAEIAVGAVLMFFVAAILEGVFRQLIASTPWRFAIGGRDRGRLAHGLRLHMVRSAQTARRNLDVDDRGRRRHAIAAAATARRTRRSSRRKACR